MCINPLAFVRSIVFRHQRESGRKMGVAIITRNNSITLSPTHTHTHIVTTECTRTLMSNKFSTCSYALSVLVCWQIYFPPSLKRKFSNLLLDIFTDMFFFSLIHSRLFLQSPANPDLLYIIFFCHTQLTVTLLLALIFGSKVRPSNTYSLSLLLFSFFVPSCSSDDECELFNLIISRVSERDMRGVEWKCNPNELSPWEWFCGLD